MAAYIYANITVNDPEAYEEYRSQAPAAIAAFGGRYLVRGGAMHVLEGDADPARQVVVEFPDMATLEAFYHSPEYQRLVPIRQAASVGFMIAVEGTPPT